MELKRILARDTRSANEKAMQLYGDDVLVISTQRVGDQTELIVAIDAEVHPNSAVVSRNEGASASEKEEVFAEIFGFVQRQEKMAQIAHVESESKLDSRAMGADGVQPIAESVPEAISADAAAKPKRQPATKSSRSRSSKSTNPSAAKKPARPSKSAAEHELAELLQQELARSREIVDLLRQEIGVLRREFSLARQVQPWESNLQLACDVRDLADQLSALGVPTGLRALLTDALAGCPDVSAAVATLRDVLGSHLRACVSETLPNGFHALVGPSGAGKTSMAVRLAHMHGAEHGIEQQAIISYADKRPGSWSQLQTMACAVGVEVYRASDPETLRVLLGELGCKTHVWIDTQADAHFATPEALLQADLIIHCHAVAPLDASVASVQRLQASATPWRSLMLTKADESDVVWHWLQALSEKPMPIAFVAHSDRVMVAADTFSPDEWVQRALSHLDTETALPQTKRPSKSTPRKRRSSDSQKVVHG